MADPRQPPEEILERLLDISRGKASIADVLGMHPMVLGKLTDKARGLVQHGKLDEAERLLADLSAVDGTSPVLPFMLGACREQKGDHGGAVAAYDETMKRAERIGLESVVPRALMCRAQALLALGKKDQALADLKKVEASDDDMLAKEAGAALSRLEGGAG